MIYVGISTQTFDLQGSLLFRANIADTELESMTRRVTRSATLDGGVSITDSGYSHGDRTLNIVAVLTEAQTDRLKYIFQNYSEVILAIPEGIFLVNLNSLNNIYGEVTLQVFVSEKLAPLDVPAYYCARDDTFNNINWWYLTKLNGGETATSYLKGLTDYECTIDLPDSTNTQLTMLYQYLIPAGDFEITLDLADYAPDDPTNGFTVSLRLRSSDTNYYSEIATRSSGASSYQTVRTHRDGITIDVDTDTLSVETSVIRVTRVGNDLSINYFADSWQIEHTYDFGANSNEISYIEIIAYDNSNRGGSVDIDNLMFRQGCPSTYPKAWTTTCSSTTSSTSSTASTTSSTYSISSTTTTTSSSSTTSTSTSTASTISTTSTFTSTSSSTTTSTSTSTTTTLTTTSSLTTTTSYYCGYNEYFSDISNWQITKQLGSETATSIGGKMKFDIIDSTNSEIKGRYLYQLPSGDFNITVDASGYLPDAVLTGPEAQFIVIDPTNTIYAKVMFRGAQDPLAGSAAYFISQTGGTPIGAYGGTLTSYSNVRLNLARVGTTFYGSYNDGTGWVNISNRDFGAEASDVVYVYVLLEDEANRGGEIQWDNLAFGSNCPDGTVAWTTSSSTTTSTSTTSSTGSTTSTTTSTASTASTTLSTASTTSTTSTSLSTTSSSSTESSTTSSSSSTTTSSTISSTSTTLSTASTTSTTSSTLSSTSSLSTTTTIITTTSSTSSSTSSTASTISTSSSTLSSTTTSSSTTTTYSTISSTSTLSTTSSTQTTGSTSTSTESTSTTSSTESTTSSTASTESTTSSTASTASTTSSTSSTVSTTSSTSTQTTTCSTTSTHTSTSSSTICSTTTTYWCEYNDTFEDMDKWNITIQQGGASASIVSNQLKITLPDADSRIDIEYQYYIGTGDAIIDIDLSDYSANDSSNGPFFYLIFFDGGDPADDLAYLRYNLDNAGADHNLYTMLRLDGDDQVDSDVLGSRPTKLRLERDGTTIKLHYYISGWTLRDSRDFGSEASNIDIVQLLMLDKSLKGGYVTVDNLRFRDGCPSGYPKVWTTTTTTTTVTTTTTTEPPP